MSSLIVKNRKNVRYIEKKSLVELTPDLIRSSRLLRSFRFYPKGCLVYTQGQSLGYAIYFTSPFLTFLFFKIIESFRKLVNYRIGIFCSMKTNNNIETKKHTTTANVSITSLARVESKHVLQANRSRWVDEEPSFHMGQCSPKITDVAVVD